MKILHVLPTRSKKYGGPVRVAEELALQTNMLGHKARLFPGNSSKNIELSKTNNYWPGFDGLKKLKASIDWAEIIHIHGLWTFPTSYAACYSRKTGKPYIIRPSGMLNYSCLKRSAFKKKIYGKIWEERNIKNASALHFLNALEVEEAKTVFDVPHLIFPNGVDITKFNDLPPQKKFNTKFPPLKNKKVALFLGRIHPIKGLDILIPAFSNALQSDSDLHLLIAGPDEGGYRSKIEMAIKELKIKDAVTFLGEIHGEDKKNVLGGADFFVLPSYHEGDSMAIKEALASRLPVLITENCHLPDIKHKNAGVIVKPTVESLTKGLIELSGDSDKLKEMSNNAINLINEKYILSNIVRNILNAYQRIINES